MQAFLSSLLFNQQLLLQERFLERHPACWLVWEPGPWAAPPAHSDDAATARPISPTLLRPGQGDALCLELKAQASPQVLVGRASTCDVCIPDATVSRHAFTLVSTGESWIIDVGPLQANVMLNGAQLGDPKTLASGDQIQAGNVALTFLSPQALAAGLRDRKGRTGR